jgi:uncharacterized protein with NRDE domain
MCLILFALQQHQDYPLIVIANRDEYYARPARSAHWWPDRPGIFAGRDLQARGTWMGVNRNGRFAAVTNVREPGGMDAGEKSRGELPTLYLDGGENPQTYLENLHRDSAGYSGYNLLLGDRNELWFGSNRDSGIRKITPGVYGISNGGFDEDWPKLSSGKLALEEVLSGTIDEHKLMGILTDNSIAGDHELPSTGVELDIERLLSSRFIRSPQYGTRACSVVTIDSSNRVSFTEQNYLDSDHIGELVRESFDCSPA